jgi:hypothetical protein
VTIPVKPRPIEPTLKFRSNDLKASLESESQRVLTQFQYLPPLRLLCYFDNESPEWLQIERGKFSGIHASIIGGGKWPHYVEKYFYHPMGHFAFDNLIYLPGSQYTRKGIAFVMVFAHALQHFVQWGESRKIAKANNLLFNNIARWYPDTKLRSWNIPHHREAMMVSKRVAEELYGIEEVAVFINAQILDGQHENNMSKKELWEVYRDLLPSTPYNALEETDRLVQEYREKLLELEPEIDFSIPQWWI